MTRETHYHRISWVELPELLEAIERFEPQRLAERSSLIALRLMMLTLVRPSGLREARWREVDTEGRQWIIPAERIKTRVRHIVPLSSQARLLFDSRGRSRATPVWSFTPPTTAAMENGG